MVSARLGAKIGVAAGVGAVVSAFGIVTPAQAYTCDSTISPTEAALRSAIADGDTVICITEGTLAMGDGESVTDNVPIVIDSDLTLVGLGDVTVDGGFNTAGFIVGASDTPSEVDLVIDNLDIIGFQDIDHSDLSEASNEKIVPVVGFNRNVTGTVTILNSQFTNNNSYVGIVAAVDKDNWLTLGTITIDNTVFDDNRGDWGTVWGYSDITVTNSTFFNNAGNYASSAIEQWSTDDTWESSSAIISGNYFEGNYSPNESTVWLDSAGGSVRNNTFAWNDSGSDTYGSAIGFSTSSAFTISYNTFYENDSDYDVANITAEAGSEITLTGNIFATEDAEMAISGTDVFVSDRGGNFSTGSDGETLDNATSRSEVSRDDLSLSDPEDNGGPTQTVALGAASIAQNVLSMTDVANELGPDLAVDQRGEARGALVDSGAWDSGDAAELGKTGVDATGIALTGGLLGAAGVAFVTRRRKA